jgi:hypothetical protein
VLSFLILFPSHSLLNVQWANKFTTLIETLKIFADVETEAGPEEVAAFTVTATDGV